MKKCGVTAQKAEWDSWKKQAECCYRIRVMNDVMPNLHVLQAGKKDIQRVPVFDQGTYIYLEKKPFVVLYESVGGRLYTARDQFHLKKMLSGTHIYQKDEKPEQKLSSEPVTDSQSLKETAGAVCRTVVCDGKADSEGQRSWNGRAAL